MTQPSGDEMREITQDENVCDERPTKDHCTLVAVVNERVYNLDRQTIFLKSELEKANTKIDVLTAFQNRLIGYTLAGSTVATAAVNYFDKHSLL